MGWNLCAFCNKKVVGCFIAEKSDLKIQENFKIPQWRQIVKFQDITSWCSELTINLIFFRIGRTTTYCTLKSVDIFYGKTQQ